MRHNLATPDAFTKVKVTNHTGLWDAELTIYSLTRFASMTWSTALEFTRFLKSEQNFLIHLVTALWSTAPLTFAQQMFLIAFMTWHSLNLKSISSWIRLCCTFICTTFKSQPGWSNAQCISTPPIMILPTTAGTSHSLNCFGYEIYMLQTSTFQNIAKLLTHPST